MKRMFLIGKENWRRDDGVLMSACKEDVECMREILRSKGAAVFPRGCDGSQIPPSPGKKNWPRTRQFTNLAVKGDVGCHISNESGWSTANRPQNAPEVFPQSHEGGSSRWVLGILDHTSWRGGHRGYLEMSELTKGRLRLHVLYAR